MSEKPTQTLTLAFVYKDTFKKENIVRLFLIREEMDLEDANNFYEMLKENNPSETFHLTYATTQISV